MGDNSQFSCFNLNREFANDRLHLKIETLKKRNTVKSKKGGKL